MQNERVAGWVAEINRYFDLSKVPSEDRLNLARSYITSEGSAQVWIMAREEEVTFLGKRLTWDWLQSQLIQHYAQPSGPTAMQAEWQALRMGIKGVDGTDTGKSTWSVRSYTNRFLHYMRLLTEHTAQTSDVLVIDRYVMGIRTGYEVLYRVMLGVQRLVLRFASLQEAISAAEEAEAEISISKISARPPSSSSSRYGEGAVAWWPRSHGVPQQPAGEYERRRRGTRRRQREDAEDGGQRLPLQPRPCRRSPQADREGAADAVRREALLPLLRPASCRHRQADLHEARAEGCSAAFKIGRPPPTSPVSGQDVVMPARPERGKGRRKAKPPRAGEREAEVESDVQAVVIRGEGGGAFDLNRLESGGEGEDEDEAPQFLGDPLLYSHDAAESTSASADDGLPGHPLMATRQWCCWTWAPTPTSCLSAWARSRGLSGAADEDGDGGHHGHGQDARRHHAAGQHRGPRGRQQPSLVAHRGASQHLRRHPRDALVQGHQAAVRLGPVDVQRPRGVLAGSAAASAIPAATARRLQSMAIGSGPSEGRHGTAGGEVPRGVRRQAAAAQHCQRRRVR